MSILKYKTKGGKLRYRVRIYDNYKIVEDAIFETKALAQEFQSRMNIKKSEAKIRGGGNKLFTFSEFWREIYLPTKSARLNPSTIQTYSHIFQRHLEPHFGDKMMCKVGAEDILGFLATREGKLGPVTLNKIRQVFAVLYNHGIRLRYFTFNPLDAVPQYKVPAINDDYNWWELGDVKKFLDWCKSTSCSRYLLYKLVLEEGALRPGEVIALKRDQLDLDRGIYRVCRSYNRALRTVVGDTKTNQARIQGISKQMTELLREHLAKHDSEYVFPNATGSHYHYRNLLARFKRDCKAAGVPYPGGLNGMRHTFASHHTMTYDNETALSRIMGHVSTAMQRRYVHLSKDFVLKNSGALNFDAMVENVVHLHQEDNSLSHVSHLDNSQKRAKLLK